MKTTHKLVFGDNQDFAQTWCDVKWNREVKTSSKWKDVTCKRCLKKGVEKYGKKIKGGK